MEIAPHGADLSDRSGVKWNQGFPAPCFDDNPNRGGRPNAAWQASYSIDGDQLCLSALGLRSQYEPGNVLQVGYQVTLTGATFEDGTREKTVILLEFSGRPKQSVLKSCLKLKF